jgi:hypothetical protein
MLRDLAGSRLHHVVPDRTKVEPLLESAFASLGLSVEVVTVSASSETPRELVSALPNGDHVARPLWDYYTRCLDNAAMDGYFGCSHSDSMTSLRRMERSLLSDPAEEASPGEIHGIERWEPSGYSPLVLPFTTIFMYEAMYRVWQIRLAKGEVTSRFAKGNVDLVTFGGALHMMADAIRSGAGWFAIKDTTCYVAMLPELQCDEQLQLHNSEGPAIRATRGGDEYYLRGFRTNGPVVMDPSSISLPFILSQRNAEFRQVLLSHAGLINLINDPSVVLLHEDRDGGVRRRLVRLGGPENEPIVAVLVECPSTGRRYALRVPPNMQTCRQAVAWTFSRDASQYRPIFQT